jgi:hypothetical protein
MKSDGVCGIGSGDSVKEKRGAGAVKIKARHIVAGTGKSPLDYVIRRFNASSAELKSPRGLDLR